jgi:hypothetical protein
MSRSSIVVFGMALALASGAQEIGYIETFSLAADREAALKELVPGTDDFYYFHALHAQNSGDARRFRETMDRWLRERNGTVNDRARELLNRQALLGYEADHKQSLDYLRRELGLAFDHARKTGERAADAPTALDSALIGVPALLRKALAEEPRSLERLEDAGLALAAGQKLSDDQRRNLLARLRRPDYPGVTDLILADLSYRDSRGFGSLALHRLLTLAQLDELLQKRPALRNESAFVTAYLAKLAPEDEVDLETDAAAREAYYDRVWAFVQTLDPVHNSLKANALYNRLRHDQAKGVRDRARFLEYVKLPRDVHYLRPEYRQQVPRADQFARLNQNFQLVALPPVANEEPLVRDTLLAFFKEDADYQAYAPYLRDDFLKPLFAEAKIVNGVGDPQQWAPLLAPEAYKRLKERVDIDFAPDNPALFGADDEVKLAAFVKNVPALLVKVYEINTFNYYRETGQPLNLAVNLDGLVASVTRRVEYKEGPERRVARAFDLPELKGRGAYVVELIGNGKSSRALVQKGRLNVLQDVTSAGHAFTVLDEAGKRVKEVSGWLGGREFAADAEGEVLVPFSTAPKSERIIIRQGGFSTLVSFDHLAENYVLKAGLYVDREALLRREKALIALRPALAVNGRPVSVKLLEEPRLVVRSTDIQGIVTEKEFAGLALREDAETVQEIQVPEGVVTLEVMLRARVQSLSQGKKLDLQGGATFALNGIERTADVQALHVGRNAGGYYLDARGRNGEPLAGEPLACFFKHRCFRDEVHAVLKTDAQGRASLGALAGIARFRAQASSGPELSWSPARDACDYPESLHGKAGETLRVPIVWEGADPASEASLLETRRGQFVKDWRGALAAKGGFLELSGLPAGEYSLYLAPEARRIAVRVTAGEVRDGFAVSARRALEVPKLAPLNVVSVTPGKESVEILLANATPFCRIHLFATRFLPEYDLFGKLGRSGAPDLLAQPWLAARAFYESGRDIGDEYRYILDRQQAAKYPGNMLERPGLLLNPWALRATEAEAERLAEGNEFQQQSAALPAAARKAFGGAAGAAAGAAEGYASVDFLKQPAVALLNLVPDKAGKITVPREALKGLPVLRVLAVDPLTSVLRCAALEDSPVATRELRQVAGLDPKKSFAEQKRITPLQARATATVGDVTTSRFETYDTVAKAYRLLATLQPDAAFEEFAFVAKWPELDAKEQRRLYSKYACHELSFFLYHKDRAFFDAVVAPHLKNKKDKTFLDRWLLGDDLTGYLEPWRYGRLNAAERVLLGKRLRAQEASVARDLRETVELIPPDMEAFNRRFDTAVQSGSLEADAGGVAGAVDELRKSVAGKQSVVLGQTFMETSDMSAADPFATAPAAAAVPAAPPVIAALHAAMPEEKAPGKAERGAGAYAVKAKGDAASFGLRQRGLALDKELKDTDADGKAAAGENLFFAKQQVRRDAARRFFQKLDQTQELAENNYWHLPIEEQNECLVAAGAFWADYAAHDGKTPFLSKAFPETATRFTEMMLALAVLDLPFKAGAHDEKVSGLAYALTPATPALLFHREICETPRGEAAGGVLVAQHFFRADDRERVENGERFDKLVTEEFLPRVVYGAQVVMTNPTGSRRKLHALLQIPMGAVPVNGGFYTRGLYVVLEPHSTQTQEYFFYFPATGDYAHYPVTLADHSRVVGGAEPFTFHVVAKLSKVDTTSWAWISQNGTEDEVLAFLGTQNLRRIEGELGEIAWRMKERAFFKKATERLEARHLFDETLWSYGVLHDDPPAIREFLRHHAFADQCGLWLQSPLLTLEPVERFDYQHLEYAPLVNPRAHQVGAKRTILNTRFREHYQLFLRVLSYKAKLDAADTLAVSYYLSLQDRVAEAVAWFGRVDRKAVAEQLQCDYLEAYLALYRGDVDTARKIAKRRAAEGVDRWRDRFAQVLGQLDELAGGPGAAADQEKRDQAQAALAASEPALELQVEAGRIRLDTRNVKACALNFYPMDIELLFSRSPFLQEGAAQFSYIRPALSRTVEIAAGKGETVVELPAEFKAKNVMVEALAAGVRKSQAYYANTLKVQMIEAYGQVVVTHAETGKPVPGAYVKVYAKGAGGEAKFFKDGYTDLRGRFDYASLNTNELEDATRLAVLVLSESFGAVVREAEPPKR